MGVGSEEESGGSRCWLENGQLFEGCAVATASGMVGSAGIRKMVDVYFLRWDGALWLSFL